MTDHAYRKILEQSPVGYAYFKVLCDSEGVPVDCVLVDCNLSFTTMTGYTIERAKGSAPLEILRYLHQGEPDCAAFFGEVALSGGTKEYEQFFEQQNMWCKVIVNISVRECTLTV